MSTSQSGGQRHDRIDSEFASDGCHHPPAPNHTPPVRVMESETSISQKMMSATIGSVLTSLLGESNSPVFMAEVAQLNH